MKSLIRKVMLTLILIIAHWKISIVLNDHTLNNFSQTNTPSAIEEFPLFFYNKIKWGLVNHSGPFWLFLLDEKWVSCVVSILTTAMSCSNYYWIHRMVLIFTINGTRSKNGFQLLALYARLFLCWVEMWKFSLNWTKVEILAYNTYIWFIVTS